MIAGELTTINVTPVPMVTFGKNPMNAFYSVPEKLQDLEETVCDVGMAIIPQMTIHAPHATMLLPHAIRTRTSHVNQT